MDIKDKILIENYDNYTSVSYEVKIKWIMKDHNSILEVIKSGDIKFVTYLLFYL